MTKKKSIREGENGWRMRTAPELTVCLCLSLGSYEPFSYGFGFDSFIITIIIINFWNCFNNKCNDILRFN